MIMFENIDQLLHEVNSFTSSGKDETEQFRLRFNGKKGILNDLFEKCKEVPNDRKKEYGQRINSLKQAVAAAAVREVPDDVIVGVGTGSTANFFIEALGARVEAYDPATDTWETLPPMPTARGGMAGPCGVSPSG